LVDSKHSTRFVVFFQSLPWLGIDIYVSNIEISFYRNIGPNRNVESINESNSIRQLCCIYFNKIKKEIYSELILVEIEFTFSIFFLFQLKFTEIIQTILVLA